MSAAFQLLTKGLAFSSSSRPQSSLLIVNEQKITKTIQDSKVRVFGTDIPTPLNSFEELNLPDSVISLLNENEVLFPTPIQKQAIPTLVSNRDLMAVAPTGSGKTLAFLIPILLRLETHESSGFRALIVVPTVELAFQIEREVLKVNNKFRVCLLSNKTLKTAEGEHHYDILITTPNTLVGSKVSLANLKILILDEGDRLMEGGFLEQTDSIVTRCPEHVAKAIFSATLNSGVEQLAMTFMNDPIRIIVGTSNSASCTIDQKLLFVGSEEGKVVALKQLFQEGLKLPALVFLDSIDRSNRLFLELNNIVPVDVIHSSRSTQERQQIVKNFRLGKIYAIITTELLARGLDFKNVKTVINYDIPKTTASYIHRIGRAGRNGKQGYSQTLFTEKDKPYIKSIVNVMKNSNCEVPDYLTHFQKLQKRRKRA